MPERNMATNNCFARYAVAFTVRRSDQKVDMMGNRGICCTGKHNQTVDKQEAQEEEAFS